MGELCRIQYLITNCFAIVFGYVVHIQERKWSLFTLGVDWPNYSTQTFYHEETIYSSLNLLGVNETNEKIRGCRKEAELIALGYELQLWTN